MFGNKKRKLLVGFAIKRALSEQKFEISIIRVTQTDAAWAKSKWTWKFCICNEFLYPVVDPVTLTGIWEKRETLKKLLLFLAGPSNQTKRDIRYIDIQRSMWPDNDSSYLRLGVGRRWNKN